MSPRAADPAVGRALIDRAAAILAEEGSAKLTLRRLTRDVGVSTMAVYTHFGSMEQLRLEICNEAFRRLAVHLASVGRSDDPTADLAALGHAYVANARENPHLYRAMFLETLPEPLPEMAADWYATFEVLLDAVRRWLDARAASGHSEAAMPHDAEAFANLLWGTEHGLVSLELAGLLTPDQTDAAVATSLGVTLHASAAEASRR